MSGDTESELELDVEDRGQAIVVRIVGSAGMNEAEAMRRELVRLANRQIPVIVLDLSDLEFISSLGLGAIIAGHLKSRHHNGQIKLVNPRPAVMKLLETTRLTKLFAIYDTVEQALAG